MNRRTLDKLYGLRGMLKAYRDIVKIDIEVAEKRNTAGLERWTQGYLDGHLLVCQRELRHYKDAISLLTQIISEVRYARE